jgi:aminopeptidase N
MKMSYNLNFKDYLKKHKYGYVNNNDMISSFQNTLDKQNVSVFIPKLENFFNPWTLINGYPVINVKTLNASRIQLTQEYFIYDRSLVTPEIIER